MNPERRAALEATKLLVKERQRSLIDLLPDGVLDRVPPKDLRTKAGVYVAEIQELINGLKIAEELERKLTIAAEDMPLPI